MGPIFVCFNKIISFYMQCGSVSCEVFFVLFQQATQGDGVFYATKLGIQDK